LNLVDSSGWLEYLANGINADAFAEPLIDIDTVLVPVICFYEVFKVVLRERNESDALQAAALMQQGRTVEITQDISIQAAKNSIAFKLPMADSMIYTIARRFDAILWTQDEHFKNLEGVRYFSGKGQ
jgi:predicted nucleic acid-binding protein